MILQTGGVAVAEISTRSRSFSRAISWAWAIGTIPTCLPSESIRRTSGTRIMSLMRFSGSAGLGANLGLRRGGKIRSSSCYWNDESTDNPLQSQRARGHQLPRLHDEFLDGQSRLFPGPLADADAARGRFLLADHQHERDLLHLRVADLRAELLVAAVDRHPHLCGLQFLGHRISV